MKILISTDDGEVIDIIPGNEIGDLGKCLPRAELLERIRSAMEKDAELDPIKN